MGLLDFFFGNGSKSSYGSITPMEQEYPLKGGKEHLGCYGAFFIHAQPARTLKMTGNPEALKKYDLEKDWGITSAESAKSVLQNLADLQETKDIDLSVLADQDIIDVYREYELSGTKFSSADTRMTAAYNRYNANLQAFRWNNEYSLASAELYKKNIKATFSEVLSVSKVTAWDIERLAGVARKCYYVGYLTEDECYEYLEKASELAKQYYKTWREYIIGYFIGRGICYNTENLGQWNYTAGELLNATNSIWKQYGVQ
jgi:Protein of unknown function (DUF1266).